MRFEFFSSVTVGKTKRNLSLEQIIAPLLYSWLTIVWPLCNQGASLGWSLRAHTVWRFDLTNKGL